MDKMDAGVSNSLTLLDRIDIQGRVTAADASRDGKKLAVLTYNAIWVFEKPLDSDHYFRGKIAWLPISAKQAEAICWDNEETLLITNEQRDVYYVSVDKLIVIQ